MTTNEWQRQERFGRLTRASDIQPEDVTFFWRGRLAAGKITVIDGDPGLGKSTVTLAIAAAMSRGEALPGDSGSREPMNSIILSAEDGKSDTIRPRLDAAKADTNRVLLFDMVNEDQDEFMPGLPEDIGELERWIVSSNSKLVVIDPFVAYLNSEKNANRDQDVRSALAPLASMAERTGTAVILLRHLNKSLGSSPMYRGGGSIGIIGAARFGFIIAKDPGDDTGQRRILAPQKINIGPEPPGLAYHIQGVEGKDVGCIEWLGETETSLSALLDAPKSEEETQMQTYAREWLDGFIGDVEVPAQEVYREAKKVGINDRSLARARQRLGMLAVKKGFGTGGGWVWSRTPLVRMPDNDDLDWTKNA